MDRGSTEAGKDYERLEYEEAVQYIQTWGIKIISHHPSKTATFPFYPSTL